jgi:hypothetical protein
MNVGYFTFLNDTESLVISNYNQFPFILAKVILAIGMFFSVSMNINPMRSNLLEIINKSRNNDAFVTTSVVI